MVLFLKVFLTEFIAEMGDKTQLMLIALTSKYKLKDIILTDICPFSLGTDVLDIQSRESVMVFIIDRNSPLPTSR